MKTVIFFAKVLVIVLLILNLFFWLLAHGSGHKIPPKTDWSFGISSLVLLGLAFLLNFVRKKMK
ncbi:MAG: hypothetical protein U5N85_08160 [Arcicella sp.]|nr:hypothetical protein [Arcicella sp.]